MERFGFKGKDSQAVGMTYRLGNPRAPRRSRQAWSDGGRGVASGRFRLVGVLRLAHCGWAGAGRAFNKSMERADLDADADDRCGLRNGSWPSLSSGWLTVCRSSFIR